MTASRFAMRRDENHSRLSLCWRHMGGSWLDLYPLEKGQPDALLGFRRATELVEVKAEGENPRKEQVEWHRKWRGSPVQVVRTLGDLERLAREMGG